MGNIWFSSVRNLKYQQCRYQDDIESLLYIIYWFINDTIMPWTEIHNRIASQSLISNETPENFEERYTLQYVKERIVFDDFFKNLMSSCSGMDENDWRYVLN